jgi:predicted TIM-barrel fold metal-dependent hydrolase
MDTLWPAGILIERQSRTTRMLIDSHCHIFTARIVDNMQTRPALVEQLHLNVLDAFKRLEPAALQASAEENGLEVCLLLPSTGPHRIRAENDRFIGFTRTSSKLRTLATLHPMMKGMSHEISRMFDLGIVGFKFSSFSQKFDLSSPEVEVMLTEVGRLAGHRNIRPVVVVDTFARADTYLDANPNHLTTPFKLSQLVNRHQGINFIGAHMGGLLADFDEIRKDLPPASNLYLDTSNAAHTLEEEQFVELLRNHGSSRILFGTDWPWFVHSKEMPKIRNLLVKAGCDRQAQAAIFGGNASRVFGF